MLELAPLELELELPLEDDCNSTWLAVITLVVQPPPALLRASTTTPSARPLNSASRPLLICDTSMVTPWITKLNSAALVPSTLSTGPRRRQPLSSSSSISTRVQVVLPL